ncbi:MAG: DUF5615 family PIN-like protein [Deltaproteobacteria bacterium]|nr:DUF5615 family PIN-like protein [Deltaproteobacteria bacterium]
MKVKLDENVPAACAETVRAMGHDVLTVEDQAMAGWSDDEIWPVVQRENRLFVTQDRGFGDLRRYPVGSHHGVLLLRPRKMHPADITSFLEHAVSTVSLEEISGCLAVADPHGVRIRRPSRED